MHAVFILYFLMTDENRFTVEIGAGEGSKERTNHQHPTSCIQFSPERREQSMHACGHHH